MSGLFVDRGSMLLLLATAALIVAAIWWQSRKRELLYVLCAIGALALVFLIWDHFRAPTDSELIKARLDALTKTVDAGRWDQLWDHVADDFQIGARDKKAFRLWVDRQRQRYEVHRVQIWDFAVIDIDRPGRKARASFHVKVHGNFRADALVQGEEYYLCRATFRLERDEQWRLQSFELFNPYVETKQPLPLPG
jgi:hypothetical protein